jgi:hypothetical protein
MGHAEIVNRTPFAFEASITADEEGCPLLVPIVKATYDIQREGSLVVAEKQRPVTLAGELYGKPGVSSYKYEPECAFMKPATDVVLIGEAHPPVASATEVYVSLRAGSLEKTVRVVGDRFWSRSLGMIVATAAEPIQTIPLTWERAFGGWDRSHPDPEKHALELRNPVGTGFRSKHGRFEDGVRLPNIEDPRRPITGYSDSGLPVGFGFTSSDWQPRAAFAGTYDEKWTDERMPLLPVDFDRRFFNAAAPGLTAAGYFRGNEAVVVENASACGTIAFHLPGAPPPLCQVRMAGRGTASVSTKLDTVIINTYEDLLILIWRGYHRIPNGPHDVDEILIQAEEAPAPAARW